MPSSQEHEQRWGHGRVAGKGAYHPVSKQRATGLARYRDRHKDRDTVLLSAK
jgi:hypothetical protein